MADHLPSMGKALGSIHSYPFHRQRQKIKAMLQKVKQSKPRKGQKITPSVKKVQTSRLTMSSKRTEKSTKEIPKRRVAQDLKTALILNLERPRRSKYNQ